jgi:WD40 repeat protein/mono/diheme cytochrome c family protein
MVTGRAPFAVVPPGGSADQQPDLPPLEFKASVKNDPERTLKGVLQARIDRHGLRLRRGKKLDLVLPSGTPARHLAGNRVAVRVGERDVTLAVMKFGAYQTRLADDLVEFLTGRRGAMDPGGYRLEWYLYVPAALPLAIPVLTLGGALPAMIGFGAASACFAIAQAESLPRAARVAFSLVVSLVAYIGTGVLLWGLAAATRTAPVAGVQAEGPRQSPRQLVQPLAKAAPPQPVEVKKDVDAPRQPNLEPPAQPDKNDEPFPARVFRIPGSKYQHARFSPDGRTVLSSGDGNLARLWDRESGRMIRSFPGSFADFTPDGGQILSSDGTMILVHPADRDVALRQSFLGDRFEISRDGRRLATYRPVDGTLCSYDLTTGDREAAWMVSRLPQALIGFRLAPDARTVALSLRDTTLEIRDLATGAVTAKCQGPTLGYDHVAYSPDGGTIACSAHGTDVTTLYNPVTGQVQKTYDDQTHGAVAFSPDGRWLASGSRLGEVTLREIASGKLSPQLPIDPEANQFFPGFKNQVEDLTFSADGRYLAASTPEVVKVWDIGKLVGAPVRAVPAPRTGPLTSVARRSSPPARRPPRAADAQVGPAASPAHEGQAKAASGPEDEKTRGETARPKPQFQAPDPGAKPVSIPVVARTAAVEGARVNALAFTKTGRVLIVATNTGLVSLDLDSGERRKLLNLPADALALSRDAKILACSYELSPIFRCEIDPPRVLGKLTATAMPGGHRAMEFSPSGDFLATDWPEGFALIRVADCRCTEVKLEFKGPTQVAATVDGLDFTPDGRVLLVASRNVVRFEIATRQLLSSLEGPWEGVSAVRHSPAGQVLATASEDKMVHFWNPATGEHQKMLKGFRSAGSALAFTPDGRVLLAGSGGSRRAPASKGEVLAMYAETAQPMAILQGLESTGVRALAVAPDGVTVAGLGLDGSLRVWDLSQLGGIATAPPVLRSESKPATETAPRRTAATPPAANTPLRPVPADVGNPPQENRKPEGRPAAQTPVAAEPRTMAQSRPPAPAADAAMRPMQAQNTFKGNAGESPAATAQTAGPPDGLATAAKAVLDAHCHRCHGESGTAEGGFNIATDRKRLIAAKYVVPGDARGSPLLRRVSTGEMPPSDVTKRPTDAEVATLVKWAQAGAPDWDSALPRRPISLVDEVRIVRDDFAKHKTNDHRAIRYLTLTPLYNAGYSEDELQTCRLAMFKLLNSLSWKPELVIPEPLNEQRTLYRIETHAFGWMGGEFDWGSQYPYGTSYEGRAEGLYGVLLPARADHFIAEASRPPRYYTAGKFPQTVTELEKMLKVDSAKDIADGAVMRAGFVRSGVALHNRLIERHEAPGGYYWKSYDFASSQGRQNLFGHPLGPGASAGGTTFQHDYGEVLFRLPNGLQGYMLSDARGNRLDRGPTNVVSDPKHPERVVENGISCMSCHPAGFVKKADEVRPLAESGGGVFTGDERAAILRMYPPRQKFEAALRTDADDYKATLTKLGIRPGSADPVTVTTRRYQADVDLNQAAAELWMSPEDFRRGARRANQFLAPDLAPLLVPGGSVKRDSWEHMYAGAAHQLNPVIYAREVLANSNPYIAKATKLVRAEPAARFQLSELRIGDRVESLAPIVDPTFRSFADAGEDERRLRLYDLATGELRFTFPDQGRVLKPTFSLDGSMLAANGQDNLIRFFDTARGTEISRTTAEEGKKHPIGIFNGIAFNAAGTELASADGDVIRVIDPRSGAVRRTIRAPNTHLFMLAYTGDGNRLLCADARLLPQIQAIDLKSGKPKAVELGTSYLQSATFSPDGKHCCLTFSNSTLELLDASTMDRVALERLALDGQESPRLAMAVAFSPDSKYLAMVHDEGVISLWEMPGLRLIRAIQASPQDSFRTIRYSPDGKRLATGAADGRLRIWDAQALANAGK